MAVTDTHEEKETLAVDVLLPGHEARVTTPLFLHSKKSADRAGGRPLFYLRLHGRGERASAGGASPSV